MIENLYQFYFNQGLGSAKNDYLTLAVESLKKAVVLKADAAEAWDLMGLCYYRMGRFGNSRFCWGQSASFSRLWQNDIEEEKLHLCLQQIEPLLKKKRFKKAVRIFEKMTASIEGKAHLLSFAGMIKLKSKDYKGAVSDFTQALTIDRSNSKAAEYLIYINKMNKPVWTILDVFKTLTGKVKK